MTDLVIRNLDQGLRTELKNRADLHGWSVAEEARALLQAATRPLPAQAAAQESIVAIARRLFGPAHGADLSLPPRQAALEREPPRFLD